MGDWRFTENERDSFFSLSPRQVARIAETYLVQGLNMEDTARSLGCSDTRDVSQVTRALGFSGRNQGRYRSATRSRQNLAPIEEQDFVEYLYWLERHGNRGVAAYEDQFEDFLCETGRNEQNQNDFSGPSTLSLQVDDFAALRNRMSAVSANRSAPPKRSTDLADEQKKELGN